MINLNGSPSMINLWIDVRGYSHSSTPGTPDSPNTSNTQGNVDSDDIPTDQVGGIIWLIRRKVVKKKVKAVAEDPIVEVMTKKLSILRLTKLKNSEMLARYVVAQETKAQACK